MMHHAGLPRRYWDHCFATTIFLINTLHTPTLDMAFPFKALNGKEPDYTSLLVIPVISL